MQGFAKKKISRVFRWPQHHLFGPNTTAWAKPMIEDLRRASIEWVVADQVEENWNRLGIARVDTCLNLGLSFVIPLPKAIY